MELKKQVNAGRVVKNAVSESKLLTNKIRNYEAAHNKNQQSGDTDY